MPLNQLNEYRIDLAIITDNWINQYCFKQTRIYTSESFIYLYPGWMLSEIYYDRGDR